MQMEIPELSGENIGEVELPYLFYEGGPSQIVFVHATGFLPWLWHPVAREFVPRSGVWAPFFCDYRPGDPYRGGLSWDTMARDLAVFCRSVNIESPLMVGHSMGATLSVIAAAKYGLEACGMVLVEPIFLPEAFYSQEPDIKKHPLAFRALNRTDHWENEGEAWAYLKSKALFADWDEEVLRLYLKYGMRENEKGGLRLTCPPLAESALFMGGWGINPWPLLRRVECPVMVAEGEMTENKGLVDIGRVMSFLPRGEHRMVAGAGHLIPMQKPREVVGMIRDVLPACRP